MPEKRNTTSIVIVNADTPDDLKSQIDRLKIGVPPRAQSAAMHDREQWQIQHLLLALFCARQLPPPVRLHKRDAPDFLLEIGNMRIGVEATEAINPDYVRAQMHPAAQEGRRGRRPVAVQVGNPRPLKVANSRRGWAHTAFGLWLGRRQR